MECAAICASAALWISMSEQEKKDYRRAIWFEWRKIVARKKLTSYEYKLIEGYFADAVPVEIIIRAIKQACSRARANGTVVYSLGFVNQDIESLKRQAARMKVGSAAESDQDWLKSTAESLDEIAGVTNNPELRLEILELKSQLPALTRDAVESRYREINGSR